VSRSLLESKTVTVNSRTLLERETDWSRESGVTTSHGRWTKRICVGLLAGVILAAGAEIARLCLTHNLHAVIPGKVYRSAQLSPANLESVVRRYGIRTVVNLRGCSDPNPWYVDECRATHEMGIQQADICFSAGRLPSDVELRRFVRTLDKTEYPILLHCFRGADRTGMASALVLLLQGGTTFEEARQQLGPRYGHAALGRPAHLDDFLDSYGQWLVSERRVHSAATVREWLDHGYVPGDCRCCLRPLRVPDSVPIGRPSSLTVEVENTGTESWALRAGTNAGTHLRYLIWDPDGSPMGEQRSGLFDADIRSGETIPITIVLPALEKSGRYHLFLDMTTEQHCSFHQTGSEPLEIDIEAR
jgi:protein tyrosine phosphatase (PTP) superfamily phosphohydrolase (DUF442 family)